MIPVLQTERLVLRAFDEADLDAFAAMQADAEVMRFLGVGPSAGQPRTRAETWASMAGILGQWALRGCGLWAVEREGRFIGRAGILRPEGWPEPELAYALARDAWGQGFAVEAAGAALAWAREALPGEDIVSFIRAGNLASCRVAMRLGGVRAGEVRLGDDAAERWVYPE
jgi:RimJ/RimL family protein N-acetyltransferase